MILRTLSLIVRWGWPFLLAVWALLFLVTWFAAPPWNEVAQDREFAFLPSDSPSRRAEEEFAKAFPQDRLASSIVLLLHRADKEQPHLQKDLKFIDQVLQPELKHLAEKDGGLAFEIKATEGDLFSDEGPSQPQKRSIIARISTPNTPGIGALLVSPDGQALLVVLELTTEFLSKDNWDTIEEIEKLVHQLRDEGKMPQGLEIALSGSAVIGRDHTRAQVQSIRATGWLTVVLVVALLILIYRAPLLALIPLVTVFLSVQVALHLLALLAGTQHLILFQGIQIFITILAYGAGVDYCLFLTARYREELDQGHHPADAVARAVCGVSGALIASAATVICGIGMMYFAQFGKFHQAGIAIPLALSIVLAATLTFSSSLLRLAGRWAFWPHQKTVDSTENGGPAQGRRKPAG